jgi:hypothetical protein
VYRPEDLRRYFAGEWHFERALADLAAGLRGAMAGRANFTPDGAGLHYHESGEIRLGAYQGLARRSYRYEFPDPQCAVVRFADGRLFCRFELSRGRCRVWHRCGADLYEGIILVRACSQWQTLWRVRGPNKCQLIRTRYRREESAALDSGAAGPRLPSFD